MTTTLLVWFLHLLHMYKNTNEYKEMIKLLLISEIIRNVYNRNLLLNVKHRSLLQSKSTS